MYFLAAEDYYFTCRKFPFLQLCLGYHNTLAPTVGEAQRLQLELSGGVVESVNNPLS
jgi:hypothetical protein